MFLTLRLNEVRAEDAADPIPRLDEAIRETIEGLRRSGQAEKAIGEGDVAPDFELPDCDGKNWRLSALYREKPLVVSFYRGGWCPYCSTELAMLEEYLDEIRAAGGELVAVGPEVAAEAKKTRADKGVSFPTLIDKDLATARRYGLVFRLSDVWREEYMKIGVDLSRINGTKEFELPIPATYVIDRSGLIRQAFVEPDYTQRLDPELIVHALSWYAS